jgi:hypothetical protein
VRLDWNTYVASGPLSFHLVGGGVGALFAGASTTGEAVAPCATVARANSMAMLKRMMMVWCL